MLLTQTIAEEVGATHPNYCRGGRYVLLTQTIAEEVGEFGVPVGHVALLLIQGHYHIP